ncbi:MAG: hypothetical protein ACI9XO_001741 [Paraglaciecola sp.]|jgi:hypothetical protein
MITRTTLFFILLITVFNSCVANKIYLDSRVEESTDFDLKKISLVVEGGLQTIAFLDSLANILQNNFQRYGIETQKFVQHPLELKSKENLEDKYALLMKSYQPDAVFTISEIDIQSGTKHTDMGNQSYSVSYSDVYFALEMNAMNNPDFFSGLNCVTILTKII